MSRDLRTLPAVVALAEEQARELHPLIFVAKSPAIWMESLVDAHLDLLCDLERPASRDAIARLIAEVIGWDAFDVTKAVESSAEMLAGLYRVAGLPELPRWEPVPPPAEALRLIAIAVLGGSCG